MVMALRTCRYFVDVGRSVWTYFMCVRSADFMVVSRCVSMWPTGVSRRIWMPISRLGRSMGRMHYAAVSRSVRMQLMGVSRCVSVQLMGVCWSVCLHFMAVSVRVHMMWMNSFIGMNFMGLCRRV